VSGGAVPNDPTGAESVEACCFDCRFWDAGRLLEPEDAGSQQGDCRRHAPRPYFRRWAKDDEPIDADQTVQPSWPQTFCDEWCGEFEGRAP